MDKRKVLRICLIAILVIFAMALVEITIRALSSGVNTLIEKHEEKKKQDEIYNSEDEIQKRQIQDFLNENFSAISNEDYDFVYNNLNEIYREYKFNNDKNKMISYIKENFLTGTNKSISNITKYGDCYQILVRVTSGDSFDSKRLSVKMLEDNEFELFLDECTKISREESVFQQKNIEYSMKYSYDTFDYTTYVIDIRNIDQTNTIKLDYNNVYAISHSNENVQGNKIDLFEIKPNETKRIEVSFANNRGISAIFLEGTQNEESIKIYISFGEQ